MNTKEAFYILYNEDCKKIKEFMYFTECKFVWNEDTERYHELESGWTIPEFLMYEFDLYLQGSFLEDFMTHEIERRLGEYHIY